MTAGASAFYVFANALIYWVTKLQLSGLAGSVLYIGYSALVSFLFFILTGMFSLTPFFSVSFLALVGVANTDFQAPLGFSLVGCLCRRFMGRLRLID